MFLCSSQLKHHVAAESRGRFSLNAISMTPKGTISTDGHSLMFVPYPEVDPAEAPQIEGINPASPAPQAEPFLLSPDDAARAAAMVGKRNRFAPPITQYIQAEVRGDSLALGATDLSNAQTMTMRCVDGAYPDVGSVIPDYSAAKVVTVNLDQFLRTLKALRGVTRDDVVTLRLIDDQQAIGISAKDGTCALCMPVQVDKPEDHVPDKLAELRTAPAGDGPPPAKQEAPPAAPDDEEDDEEAVPTETEMHEAQAVYDALPPVPEPAQSPGGPIKRHRRRRKTRTCDVNELQEIVAGS